MDVVDEGAGVVAEVVLGVVEVVLVVDVGLVVDVDDGVLDDDVLDVVLVDVDVVVFWCFGLCAGALLGLGAAGRCVTAP